jgi:Sec-independent protein translocase protein TatA
MGGFHFLDILVVALIGLAIFGPKALQSMARSAGKGMGQAKELKDKIMSDLPLDEINKVTDSIPQVPLNSRQAFQMLMKSDTEEPTSEKAEPSSEKPTSEKKVEAKADEAH